MRVGLTGGIASGKSLVAGMFAELGVPVIDTDAVARELVRPGQPALDEIITAFGREVLAPDGSLNRSALRERVFQDAGERSRLEAILHPRIRIRSLDLSAAAGGPYQVLVVPLLVESGFSELVDRVLVVDCPEALQRERLLTRDAGSPTLADRMIAAQLRREQRLAAADDVIDNSGDMDATRRQVASLHEKYLALANIGR